MGMVCVGDIVSVGGVGGFIGAVGVGGWCYGV